MPTYYLDPIADQKADWTENPAGASWDRLNDAVRSPTAPSTASDWIECSTDAQFARCNVNTSTLNLNEQIARIRQVQYCSVVSANHVIRVQPRIMDASLTTVAVDGPQDVFTGPLANAWRFGTWWTGYPWTITELNRLCWEVQLGEGAAEAGLSIVYAGYIEVETYFSPSRPLLGAGG